MKRLYCLFMDREDIKQSMKIILQGIDYVKKGISICIFPEGTRNRGKETELLPFKEGSFKIAEKTGCPVVPMAISNSASVIADHMPRVTPCHIIIEYGKPIYPKELSREDRKRLGIITSETKNRKFLHTIFICQGVMNDERISLGSDRMRRDRQ